MNDNTFDDLDKDFDSVIDTEDNNDENDLDIFNNNNDDEEESKEETLETLEDIMSSGQETETKTDNKSNNEVNNDKQNAKQQSNKSKGNNNSQDLVDSNGNIIAKAGAERRFYEENVRLKRERDRFNSEILPKIKQEYDNLASKVNAYNEVFKSMQADDLTSQDLSLGIQLIKNWKKSPADTIKFLLTQAKSYGINIDNKDSSSIDMQAINTMLDQKLQPFIQEREIQQKQIVAKQKAQKVYNEFINNYPDAKNHINEIAFLYRKNPNRSLGEIYYQLKNYYLENNYHFDTPLAEIMKQKQQNKKTFNGINVNQNIKSVPITSSIAKANDSYDNIIKDVLKQIKK